MVYFYKLQIFQNYKNNDTVIANDYKDVRGTSPRKGEGRIMQEQLSRVTQEQLPRNKMTAAILLLSALNFEIATLRSQ